MPPVEPTPFQCPNGHAFPSAVAMPCGECDARVTCVPLAQLVERGGAIFEQAGEIARLRDAIERACGALSEPRATNRERANAAGLILTAAAGE